MNVDRAVIGALIRRGGHDGAAIDVSLFQDSTCKELFESITLLEAEGKPVDVITVSRACSVSQAEVGQITRDAIAAANLDCYIGVLREKTIRGRLIGQLHESLVRLEAGDPPGIVVRKTVRALEAAQAVQLSGPELSISTCGELAQMTFKESRWAVTGFVPEGAELLAGKPKMGKSWLVLSFGIAVAEGEVALGSIPVEQGDALYLALEHNIERVHSLALQAGIAFWLSLTCPNRKAMIHLS